MDEFCSALELCSLYDMGYNEAKYTWTNCQSNGDFIKERFDRVVGNNKLRGIFPDMTMQVLLSKASNHKPILIILGKDTEDRTVFSRGFKFEASWLLDDEYNNVMQKAWGEADGDLTAVGVAQEKLALCQKRLK
jgi:hypothetical protein